MKVFEANGTYGKEGTARFTKTVKAENKKMAREYIYSLIGGKQHVSRRNINIEKIEGVK